MHNKAPGPWLHHRGFRGRPQEDALVRVDDDRRCRCCRRALPSPCGRRQRRGGQPRKRSQGFFLSRCERHGSASGAVARRDSAPGLRGSVARAANDDREHRRHQHGRASREPSLEGPSLLFPFVYASSAGGRGRASAATETARRASTIATASTSVAAGASATPTRAPRRRRRRGSRRSSSRVFFTVVFPSPDRGWTPARFCAGPRLGSRFLDLSRPNLSTDGAEMGGLTLGS